MKILFLVATSKSSNHWDFFIDRVDLTRKLDAINTWVQDALDSKNEVMFFEGGNEEERYDDDTKTLHLTESGDYEHASLSNGFLRVKAALRWVSQNKEFDAVYLGDDDIYVNIKEFLKIELTHDYIGTGALGGGGFLFTKKSINSILNYENTIHKHCDTAIYDAINCDGTITKKLENLVCAPFYTPGELYATIHYAAGKRMHFIHNTIKFFQENGYTNRKIILGGGIDMTKRYDIVSYEISARRKSCRWYDYTTDPNGWEYHGGYARSVIRIPLLEAFWPYAESSTKKFVLNLDTLLVDYPEAEVFNEKLHFLIEKCRHSLINKENLFLMTTNYTTINGWIEDSSIKETHKLNFEHLNNNFFYKKQHE